MIDGEMDAGAWSCGMVAGLIDDIPTCAELIERIMAEAERADPRPARGTSRPRRGADGGGKGGVTACRL